MAECLQLCEDLNWGCFSCLFLMYIWRSLSQSFFKQMYSYLTKIDAGKLKGKMIKEDGAQTQISAICMRVSDFQFIFAAEKNKFSIWLLYKYSTFHK